MIVRKMGLLVLFMCISLHVRAQGHALPFDKIKVSDTVHRHRIALFDKSGPKDLIDVWLGIANKPPDRNIDTSKKKELLKLESAFLPGVGYSLQTGFAAVFQYLGGFYTTNSADANQSTIETSISYTQLNQLLIPLQCSFWTKENKYNIVTDWRYLIFPQATYGLGGYSSANNAYTLDFSNIRLYTTGYKVLRPDVYLGVGYDFDYLWNIHEISAVGETDFQKYNIQNNEGGTTAVASGPTLNFLYDTRRNSINPVAGGSFFNVVYRPSLTLLGSSENWQSLVIDARKYVPIPIGNGIGAHNLLAFWSYDWLTLAGAPPYMLLPNIGGDPYGNTGRGFDEGRFRGKNMLYYENEYRFGISRNGLIGGVVFTNVESFSEENTNQFARVYAGYGAGIRIMFNKFSRTNVAVDYGFGTDGSRGVFINLGEVF